MPPVGLRCTPAAIDAAANGGPVFSSSPLDAAEIAAAGAAAAPVVAGGTAVSMTGDEGTAGDAVAGGGEAARELRSACDPAGDDRGVGEMDVGEVCACAPLASRAGWDWEGGNRGLVLWCA